MHHVRKFSLLQEGGGCSLLLGSGVGGGRGGEVSRREGDEVCCWGGVGGGEVKSAIENGFEHDKFLQASLKYIMPQEVSLLPLGRVKVKCVVRGGGKRREISIRKCV